jgi:formylglycine-generating enzyme required for sulfatase activity
MKPALRYQTAPRPGATTSAGTTSATITGLARNSNYLFKVRAVNSAVGSDYINASPSVTVPPVYTITFNANGGAGTAVTQKVEGGYAVPLTANSYKLAGFSFLGWAPISGAATPTFTDSASYVGTANATLYAVWSASWVSPSYDALWADGSAVMVSIGNGSTALSYNLETTDYDKDHSEAITYLSPFSIGQYEVTYELWYTVRTWAENNGYNFGKKGGEGHDGTAGASPTSASCRQPVTHVSWRDCIIWCNAYTEWYNAQKGTSLTCVYYADNAYTTPIKASTTSSTIGTTPGSQDDPYFKASATGFRLPTEVEWQYAASSAGAQAYDHVSGGPLYSDSSVGNYAWYASNSYNLGSSSSDYGTHTVGIKLANGLGLYDMSGNVWEWCYDWYDPWTSSNAPYSNVTDYMNSTYGPSNPYRVLRDGSWSFQADTLQVGYRYSQFPNRVDGSYGFRVCQGVLSQ